MEEDQMSSFTWPIVRRTALAAVFTTASAAIMTIPNAAWAADRLVDVTAIVDHPALDAVREGVKESLQEAGFQEGKNMQIHFQSAQGNVSTAAQIARKFVGDSPDVIVAISTPSAQTVVAATNTIPVVYSAVGDPDAAKLVPGWEASGTNVTGISDMVPADKQLSLIHQVLPQVKRIGIIYNPGEANSVAFPRHAEEGGRRWRLYAGRGAGAANRGRDHGRQEPRRKGRPDLRADRQHRRLGLRRHRQS